MVEYLGLSLFSAPSSLQADPLGLIKCSLGREICKVTFFHLIFYLCRKKKSAGETVLLTSSKSPLSSDEKDRTALSDQEGNETIDVTYGNEHTNDKALQTLSRVKYRFDNYGDVKYPSIIITTE